ncbi:acriflavine resistance protein f, partial [Lasius niger]
MDIPVYHKSKWAWSIAHATDQNTGDLKHNYDLYAQAQKERTSTIALKEEPAKTREIITTSMASYLWNPIYDKAILCIAGANREYLALWPRVHGRPGWVIWTARHVKQGGEYDIQTTHFTPCGQVRTVYGKRKLIQYNGIYTDESSDGEELHWVAVQPVTGLRISSGQPTDNTLWTGQRQQNRLQIPVLYVMGLFISILCWWCVHHRTNCGTTNWDNKEMKRRTNRWRQTNRSGVGSSFGSRQDIVQARAEDLCQGE